MTIVAKEPYHREEEFLDGCAAINAIPNVTFARRTAFTTTDGSPTDGLTADPVFLDETGQPVPYTKLDPGDIQTCAGGGSNNETLVGLWVRLDGLPAGDADIAWAITNSGGNKDSIGVDSTGHFYASNNLVKQGTDPTARNLGEWYWVVKMNDSGGGGTGTWLFVNGVRVVSAGGSGGVKNSPGGWGSANFDGSVSHLFVGQGTTSLTLASVFDAYRRAVTKMPGARGAVLM
jgi:hypothetical protein